MTSRTSEYDFNGVIDTIESIIVFVLLYVSSIVEYLYVYNIYYKIWDQIKADQVGGHIHDGVCERSELMG